MVACYVKDAMPVNASSAFHSSCFQKCENLPRCGGVICHALMSNTVDGMELHRPRPPSKRLLTTVLEQMQGDQPGCELKIAVIAVPR
eukprot:scaffold473948_cov20-Prasinocladus_malaysianus.AAC.1